MMNAQKEIKMKKIMMTLALVGSLLFSGSACFAHTPLCTCFENGDGTVTCEGGFSDGSSAAGVKMLVKDASGKILIQGKMSKNSDFEFKKPKGDYVVLFDAGEGHTIEIPGKEIVK
jgi:type 1 fimbria pilin